MRVLVTGANGFVGRAVLRELHGRGIETIAVARRTFSAIGKTEVVVVETPSSAETLMDLLACTRPSAIIHLAGVGGGVPLGEMYEANVVYGANLLAAAAARGSPRVVVSGSAAEYGRQEEGSGRVAEDWTCRPESAYGVSKLAQTFHATSACPTGPNVTVARLFNPVGEGMSDRLALGRFARRIRDLPDGGVLDTGPLDVVRDFVDVRDVARILVELVGALEMRGEVINVCTGVGMRLGDLTRRLVEVSGKRLALKETSQFSGNSTSRYFVGDPSKLARAGLQAHPIDIDDVLGRLLGSAP